jgi:Membrane protease subunits, stomatin/prohibitin homologs
MSANLILVLVGIILLIVAGVLGYTKATFTETNINRIQIVILIMLGLVLILGSQCFTIIGSGYTGVRITFGQVDERVAEKGFNLKTPFIQQIVRVNNKQQDIEIIGEGQAIESSISGKIPITVSSVTVTYQIESDKAAFLYSNVSDPNHLVTYSIASSAIKATTPSFDTDSVVVRSEVEKVTCEMLQTYIDDKYGEGVVNIIKITIGNIAFTDEYNNSVNDKNMAKQKAETQAIENEKNIKKAEADAKVKIKAAEAEKESNELLETSITDKIIVQQYLEKWDGRLPAVTSDANAMFDVSKIMDSSYLAPIPQSTALETPVEESVEAPVETEGGGIFSKLFE